MKWLTVIIAIQIGILTVGAVAVFRYFREKSYTVEAISGLRTIRTAAILYYAVNGHYTSDWGRLGITANEFADN